MSTDYKCVTEIGAVREYLAGHDLVSFDYETAPDAAYRMEEKAALDPAKAHICTMSLSVKEHTGIMIPVAHLIGTNMDTDTFYQFLREFLTDKNITKICHNYVFESSFSYKNGIVIQAPVYDTICAAQMTLKAPGQFRKLSDSGLKTLALNLCKEPLPSFTAVTEGRNFDELDPADPETIRYSCADAEFALRLYHICNNWFDKYLPNHRWIVENIESPTTVFVGMMKQNGIPMDIKAMTDAKSNADSEINRLKDEIGGITGGVEVGSNCSTAAFKNFLCESKQLPILKRTDKLAPSVDDEALLLLKDYCEEHEPELTALFDKVLEYRKWQKLKSTYLDGYLNFVNNATGRIHPDLMQLATETGRFACRRPNLQNSPQKGQDPVGIWNFIKAPDGWSLLESDYSQAEIRLCAYLSQDQVLLQAYRDGQDVHAITTSAVFNIPLEEAMDHGNPQYKHRRTVAKGTMFGIMYGIGGAGLSRNLYTNAGVTISREECDSYIQGILDKYTGMAAWQQEMKKDAAWKGYVETAMGRRRYLPGIRSQSYRDKSSAERMAINTPVQGLGADCLKYAMSLLVKELADKIDKLKINALYNHFRDSYDGHEGLRGRADQSVVTYDLLAPLVVAGEESADEAAIRERSIELLFSKKDLKKPEYRDAFQRVAANEKLLQDFGRTIFDMALSVRAAEVAKWHKEGVGKFSKELPSRVVNNLACCFAGLKLIESLCARAGLSFSDVFPFGFDACIRYLEHGAKEYLLDGGTNNQSVVEQTFEIMARMGLDGKTEYNLSDDKTKLLIMQRSITVRKNRMLGSISRIWLMVRAMVK